MKELRSEIYNLKENIYSSNIEKRKLNEKLYTLNEMSKKVDEGYNSYKEVSDKVDAVKGVKDVMAFKNINLKNRISTNRNNTAKKDVNYKGENPPTGEFIATSELKESYSKLHYNDKMTLEENKKYSYSECKELLTKQSSNSTITLFSVLSDETKYETEAGFCETMLQLYPDLQKLRESMDKDSDFMVVELQKNAHYIPVATGKGDYCALVGGDINITYKEKINTGEKSVNIWHVKKG